MCRSFTLARSTASSALAQEIGLLLVVALQANPVARCQNASSKAAASADATTFPVAKRRRTREARLAVAGQRIPIAHQLLPLRQSGRYARPAEMRPVARSSPLTRLLLYILYILVEFASLTVYADAPAGVLAHTEGGHPPWTVWLPRRAPTPMHYREGFAMTVFGVALLAICTLVGCVHRRFSRGRPRGEGECRGASALP